MKRDIVLAGVGGQGVLSVAALIAAAARDDGLHVKQGEVHGMAQRGGAVQAGLRLSDGEIHSDLVPRGGASLVLSLEMLEGLRYLEYLEPDGVLLTSSESIRNYEGYPPLEEVKARVRSLPRAIVVDAPGLARAAGLAKAVNAVMAGAASMFLPVRPETFEARLERGFAAKGERVVEANRRAFRAGREAVSCPPT